MGLGDRLQHAWNAFKSKDLPQTVSYDLGFSSSYRPDYSGARAGPDRSIVTSIYNRIAIDVASVKIEHVRLDQNGRFVSSIDSSLNQCLTLSANVDQTGRNLIQDIAMSMCEEGVVAVVPVDTSLNPNKTGSYDIDSLRCGKITQWYPEHIMVSLYNEKIGERQDIILPKSIVAIIENPLYAVMNEPNSNLRRLIHKLNILDAIDEQSGAGKLDLIIQLPYVIKSDARREQAERRRKDIEMQLSGSKYGIAYTDGTERITQLNRPAENNLLNQIEYLTKMLYNQLGLTESVFDGTADEKTMLNYHNRTIEPMLSAITNEMKRKFLTKTARTQGQSIEFFRDPFRLVPVEQLADIADKFTRNEILSSNEVRAIIGYKPVNDARADELRNKNLNQDVNSIEPVTTNEEVSEESSGFGQTNISDLPDYTSRSALEHHGIKGQKWGVRRTPEQLGHKLLKKLGKSHVLTEDVLNQYKKQHSNLNHLRISDNSDGRIFVKDGKVSAVINVEKMDNGVRQIQGMEIFDDFKGKGYSKDLLDYAVKDLGATELTVRKTNKIALNLYQNYGFETYKDTGYMYFMRLDRKEETNGKV